MTTIYRFRPLKHLLEKHQELKTKTIFFSTLEDLNDPMESISNTIWTHNSQTAWELAFDYYYFWFDHFYVNNDPTACTSNSTQQIQALREKESLLKQILAPRLAKATKITNSNEVQFIFHRIHIDLMTSFNTVEPSFAYDWNEHFEQMDISENWTSISEEHINEVLGFTLHLAQHSKEQQDGANSVASIYRPVQFLNWLEKHISPEYYVACFSERWDDIRMWSHYANGHEGVCLMFNTEECDGDLFLKSANKKRCSKFRFQKVDYEANLQPVNVLKMIEELECHRNHHSETEAMPSWPHGHLNHFRAAIATKLFDWKHECEYRLVWENLHRGRGGPSEGIPVEERRVKYEAEDLKGIIFGLNTPIESMLKVKKIIDHEYNGLRRENFTYYRVQLVGGKLEKYEIDYFS